MSTTTADATDFTPDDAQRATWIMTYTGNRFYPFAPKIADIHIADIAHALGMICRFTGHTRRFYSVAQHSVNVSLHVEAQLAADRSLRRMQPHWRAMIALQALLHDAAEAYICDLAAPIKKVMSPRYETVEALILHTILARFAVDPLPTYRHRVTEADKTLLHAEARELFSPTIRAKAGWDVPDPIDASPDIIDLCSWSPREAERLFLERYFDLDRRRSNPAAEAPGPWRVANGAPDPRSND